MNTVGILTGGGDCPGLNSVIRAVVKRAKAEGWRVLGFKNGWKGVIENAFDELTESSVSGILPKGGTILGTSRTNPYKKDGDLKKLKDNVAKNQLKAVIAVGGEDTLGAANKLCQEGVPVIGVPKTIDNDLSATDYTFGYDTALNIAMECIDRLHSTAESHNRVMVAEIMGRHAGWIALEAGIAGGADVILIPEVPVDIEEVCNLIRKRHARGRSFSIVAVAEGAVLKDAGVVADSEKDQFGHVRLGGIGNVIGSLIEQKTGFETRVTVLGHIQRGGSPTAFDRVLGTRFGFHAFDLVKEGKFGYMVSLQGTKILPVPLASAVGELKVVPMHYYEMAKLFFG
ncbi:MAG: pyrophosphate--fructose-6-phosphate 1-phosphotransferase [Omnitrophica bacterium GWA2_52_8]|nr:MAG: pyrophosphate--fructose-6-phosphate 1-phosphotransferase [Omnitrophica bacterium GWA2_52_8]